MFLGLFIFSFYFKILEDIYFHLLKIFLYFENYMYIYMFFFTKIFKINFYYFLDLKYLSRYTVGNGYPVGYLELGVIELINIYF